MTAKKSEKKTDKLLRAPKPKNKLGLVVPKITLPHDQFVKAADPQTPYHPDKINNSSQSSLTSQSSVTSHTSQTTNPIFEIHSEDLKSDLVRIPVDTRTKQIARNIQTNSTALYDDKSIIATDNVVNTSTTDATNTVTHLFQGLDGEINLDQQNSVSSNFTEQDYSMTSHTSQSSDTSQRTLDTQQGKLTISRETDKRNGPIAPEKNFQKVPNSLVTVAIPSGLFKGKSKQLYDVLYQITRGAIVPRRSVRMRKSELMKRSGIGSRITFDTNIEHLQQVGLIRETVFAGEHAGNEFEVLTIEEINTLTDQPSVTSQSSESSLTSQTNQSQKLERLVRLETSQTSRSLNYSNNNTYEKFKTLFKDFKLIDDDSPLMEALCEINEAAKKSTGQAIKPEDMRFFSELIKVFIDETNLAAGRTILISNYLAFGVENIKRRLYAPKKSGSSKPPVKKAAPEPKTVTITEGFEESSLPEALSEQSRANALIILRGMLRNATLDELQSLAGSYAAEDWNWLMTELKKESS